MKHLEAVNNAVSDSTLERVSKFGPLIELCRVLARQMDDAGDEPSTRLTAAYLSALKDLGRAINATPAVSGRSKLESMRAERARAAPSKKSGRAS